MTEDINDKKTNDAAGESKKDVETAAVPEPAKESATEPQKEPLSTHMLPPTPPVPGTKPSGGAQALSPDKVMDAAKPAEERPNPNLQTGLVPAAGRTSGIQPAVGASGKLLDRKAAYRRWLEARSKEELIELIVGLEQKEPALEITEKMMKVSTGALSPAAGFTVPPDLPYTRLPVIKEGDSKDTARTWKIVLVNLEQGPRPVGFIIDSEISVGRAVGESSPDLDLAPFGASTRGVSRLHAKLRPSSDSLCLIDQKSTNGTYCNKARLEPEKEHPLKEGDVIAFGRVNFLLKIVDSPVTKEQKALL